MNSAPVCQRAMVTVYVNDLGEALDVYAVFRSGVVMYCDEGYTLLEVMNSSVYNWLPSSYGEQHVKEIFEFVGYYPAPCKEAL